MLEADTWIFGSPVYMLQAAHPGRIVGDGGVMGLYQVSGCWESAAHANHVFVYSAVNNRPVPRQHNPAEPMGNR